MARGFGASPAAYPLRPIGEAAKTLVRQALIRLLFSRLARANTRHCRKGSEIQRILVMRPDHLGDLLLATPTLEALRKAFPRARITGAVGPWGKAMWAGNPNLNALQVVRFPGIVSKAGSKGGALAPYRLLGRAARHLAGEEYDLAIVLRFDYWWGAALLWAAGIPRRWGYNQALTRPWLTDAVPYAPGRHEVEQDLFLAEATILSLARNEDAARALPARVERDAGQPPLRPPALVKPSEGALAAMKPWLDAPRRVIIHPGAAAANKLWTIGGWAEVAGRLARQGWVVALSGSPGEHALAEAIAGEAEDNGGHELFNLSGQTASMGELAWVLQKAQMALGVDSGPMHIAAALGKPTLHLFGPSDEAIWGPWGDPNKHRVLRAPGTHPTMRLEVGSPAMEGGPEMRAITPQMVAQAIARLRPTTPVNDHA